MSTVKHPRTLVRTGSTHRSATRARAGGFTIVEMLVTVGAVALIGVGVGRLFQSAGQTVQIGRRVSTLNEYAAMVERQLRSDFESITREGPMVIRNRLIGGTGTTLDRNTNLSGVLLTSDQNEQVTPSRPRRVDEIVFFVNGRYTSLRESQDAWRFPVGTTARVYLGHGLKYPASAAFVELDDDPTFNNAVAFPASLGQQGPNELASEWTLLRHVAALCPSQRTLSQAPAGTDPDLANAWNDNAVQVGLQPAVGSIFNEEAWTVDLTGVQVARGREPARRPMFASGIVDLCSTSIANVRARLLGAGGAGAAFVGSDITIGTGRDSVVDDYRRRVQELMVQLLPVRDPSVFPAATRLANPLRDQPEHRMRYSPTPPDFTGNIVGARTALQPYRRQDQSMLSASNFVAGCTEFIVEWSFGITYPQEYPIPEQRGRLIWHGLTRYTDLNGDGVADPTEVAASPYKGYESTRPRVPFDRYFQTQGGVQHAIPRWLIHGEWEPDVARTFAAPLYSFFGDLDPTYSPPVVDVTNSTGTVVGKAPQPGFPETMDWVWPKLVRITMSVVDPTEPLAEQTYQFVLPVPQKRNGF